LAATDEETSLLRVDHHSYGRTARSYRPTRDHFSRFHIDDCHFILVHEIDVDFAGTIGRQELGLSAQHNGFVDFSPGGIDVRFERHGSPAAPGNNQYVSAGWVKDDPISIWLCDYGSNNGVSLQIEDHDGAITPAVTDEPAANARNDRDAMSDFLTRDVANRLT